jgi:hypothetical protein
MFALVAVLLAVSPDSPGYVVPPIAQSATIQAVTGNGRLTAGLDSVGTVAQLRWPGLGFWDHADYDADPDSQDRGGAHWLFLDASGTYFFSLEHWTVEHEKAIDGSLLTRFREVSGTRSASQRVRIADTEDVVSIELKLNGFSPDTQCFWYQRLRPRTQLVRGMSGSPGASPRGAGFASYYDTYDEMLIQFRPQGPSRDDWARAKQLTAIGASPVSWSVFGPGVYWGTFSPDGAEGGMCMPRCRTPISITEPLTIENGAGAIMGGAQALLQPRGEDLSQTERRVEVCLVAAPTLGGLARIRSAILEDESGVRTMTSNKKGYVGSAGIDSLLRCVDSASGAVLRAPVAIPPLGYASVFDTAWASAALDERQEHAIAGAALSFHLQTVRQDFSQYGVPGSLPAYVYTTGKHARFSDLANPSTTAWLLAAVWRHSEALPAEEGRTFLESAAVPLQSAGDFLARAPVVGGVLSGVLKPEAASLAILQTHYLGLVSARGIMTRLGRAEPAEWRSRREEAYARIRFRQLNGERAEDRESDWVTYWANSLPESVLPDDGAWQVLLGGTATAGSTPLKLPESGGAPLGPNVPMALRDALTVLGENNRS